MNPPTILIIVKKTATIPNHDDQASLSELKELITETSSATTIITLEIAFVTDISGA
jgi:hypothetical protein